MDPRTQERVERWESRPFSGDRDELSSLADREFSGAVEAAGTWLFMLNGRVVGVVDGEIEDVLDTGGTAYDAPNPALPLLSAMLEQGGEPRAKYYTNETPLSEVDRKLKDGSFTGYIELSEQVLSGDYYVVYYGGRRMAAAYIGNAERLLTGEEAFERADDEVGIYTVVDVNVEVTGIPGDAADRGGDAAASDAAGRSPSDGAGDAAASGGDGRPATGRADADGTGSSDSRPTPERQADGASTADEPAGAAVDGDVASTDGDAASADSIVDEAEGPAGRGSGGGPSRTDRGEDAAGPSGEDGSGATGSGGANAESSASSPTAGDGSTSNPTAGNGGESSAPNERAGITATEGEAEPVGESGITTGEPSANPDDGGAAGGAERSAPSADAETDERFKEEARWRETRKIPSIDPEASTDEPSSGGRSSRSESTGGVDSTGTSRSSRRSGPRPETVASTEQALRSDMLEREDKIDQLTQRVTDLQARRTEIVEERDRLRDENEELSATVDRLQSRIDELEAELERLRGGGSAGAPPASSASSSGSGSGSVQLSPQQALEQTNVFVRYDSKSRPTLATAHDGDATRGEVAKNLRLERHTQFDEENAVVVGQPYTAFVEETMQFRFVEWLVGTVLYEIRDTGHADQLGDLYDVIPRIDRVELSASISLEDDDTENVPDQVTFDVAAFDKRGTPLAVANCNDARDPATQDHLESLEADASAVNANYPDLGAAFAVTSSFFDPGALEVAEEATTSGFLSRGSKLSYVNLSRKQGYHLCLVESRSGGFHLTVPEL